jgi:hypothetical protein
MESSWKTVSASRRIETIGMANKLGTGSSFTSLNLVLGFSHPKTKQNDRNY